jgi:hypothetical protein
MVANISRDVLSIVSGEFKTLEQIFSMLSPVDLAGGVDIDLGGPVENFDSVYKRLINLLENDGHGMYKSEDFMAKLLSLVETRSGTGDKVSEDDLKRRFTIFSNMGTKFFGAVGADTTFDGKKQVKVSGVEPIFGKEFDLKGFPTMLVCSRSPFFHPANRHTRRIETFLNNMPPVVASSLVPYLDVEFQVGSDPTGVPTMNQLRFLLGSVDKVTGTADTAMLEAHQVKNDVGEFDYAGMEMFTSPQTLVNPQPNIAGNGVLNRYNPVLDPFRPFASIDNLTISVTPAVGMFSYKKAQLTIKLHDRSRLAEISDLIRPQSYSNVTIWLTYGWRAPVRSSNPYFEYINNNMLVREAYGVINSNFAFDQVGQVTINLEMFTKGVGELRTMKISDTRGDGQHIMDEIRRLANDISDYRKKLKFDTPEGASKEVRVFQVLDAAEQGEFPADMKPLDVEKIIDSLKAIKGSKDPELVKQLITKLHTLYKPDQAKKTRFDLKARFETNVTATIKKKFEELLSGADPFLPNDTNQGVVGSPLVAEVKKYLHDPKNDKIKGFNKGVVSFGKLFSVFAGQCITTTNVVDELQVFFYAFNDQCGPVSSHSIAEFPIDMQVFLDQYRDHVTRKGGERITLDDFMQLVVNAQVLDDRAIGYGLRSEYKPYNPEDQGAVVKNEGAFEKKMSQLMSTYGSFKKPAIEMYVETGHERVATEGDSDLLLQLSYSAKDATMVFDKDVQGKKLRRIMRIHVYDKQTNPHKAAATLLKSNDGKTFIEAPSTDYAKKFVDQKTLGGDLFKKAVFDGVTADAKTGRVKFTEFTNARQVKDIVSKMVPTITYGANGTMVTNMNLTSRADPLLSTVNMLRNNTVRNSVTPNGSGEGGIPLRVIPAQLSMSSMGCPLACMAGLFFIDCNTGTTIDNIYIVTGLNHVMSPGKFETQWTFGFYDSYGVFEGTPNIIDVINSISAEMPKKK